MNIKITPHEDRTAGFEESLLLKWLASEAQARWQSMAEAAASLGVTYGYIHQLKTGMRPLKHISDEFATSCARYLGIPPILVKIAAGRFTLDDWFVPQESEADRLARAVRRMRAHPRLAEYPALNPIDQPADEQKKTVDTFSELVGVDLYAREPLPAELSELRNLVLRLSMAYR